MTKIKYIFTFALLATLIYACGSSSSSEVDNFDHESQAIIDNDSLVKFLSTHYFDTSVDSVKPLVAGQTALINDTKLKTQAVTENDIEYNLYVYINRVGEPDPIKSNPTVMDSVFATYKGYSIIRTDSINNFETGVNPIWFTLTGVIRGWTYGFTNFKGGKNTTTNGPIVYENGGNGILFIPSGLAYRNSGSGTSIPPNTPLLFYINLYDIVEGTDTDNDNVASINEDPDGDGDPRNDDTDGDFIPNYGDEDDDGDGVLTKYEDKNGDGNPANDFNDPNNPTLADYLNPDVKIKY